MGVLLEDLKFDYLLAIIKICFRYKKRACSKLQYLMLIF